MSRSLSPSLILSASRILILTRPGSTGDDTRDNGSINLPPSGAPCALDAGKTANLELGGSVNMLGEWDMVSTWKKKGVWSELLQCWW